MPFWWYRRNKPWFGRWRKYKKRYTKRRRYTRRRKYNTRRRPRRTYTRRRRHRRKVRRKQKKIIVKQWQPESIRKCKIKGGGTLVLGAQGTQPRCYTVYKDEWTNPKNPCGGGFGVELFTLKYLYDENVAKNNIWTTSNDYWDLCRYTGSRITLFRHPETDFIFCWDIQPPFTINKYTYMFCHPHFLLQRKHKKFLLSTATKPNGRLRKTVRIRPPKQMITKWFFQEDFANYGLLTLIASACNFRYPWLGCCNENQIITLYYIQPEFYRNTDWSQARETTGHYEPYTNISKTLTFKYFDLQDKPQQYTMKASEVSTNQQSISYETGWFNWRILRTYDILNGSQQLGLLPTGVLRYNPVIDTGENSKIWLVPTNAGHWNLTKRDDLLLEGYPLWAMLYGFTSYIKHVLKDSIYFKHYMLCVQSDALYRVSGSSTLTFYPLVDTNFMKGKLPSGETPTFKTTHEWYPNLTKQLQAIAQIVNCGPYTPKYDQTKNSTWQLNYSYSFYFKWGGSLPPTQDPENPTKKGTYDVPDTITENVQIADPTKQRYKEIFKSWDYRRGSITKKALKRMYANLQSDATISTDSEVCSSPQKKKRLPLLKNPSKENKKIQDCLLSLCEESTCQEPQEQNQLFKLIQEQHQQQQQIKFNLLTLMSDLKSKQRMLLHQTGLLN
nr:MAG: ORF1 [Torque teno midi virus]